MGSYVLETPRLLIREFDEDDVDAVYNFSTNEDVVRYTGDAGDVKTKEDALNIIRNVWMAEYEKYGYARWAVVLNDTDEVIGFCGFKFLPEDNAPDIGYRFLPQYWGQGIATEAVSACMDYAKEIMGLENIIGDADVENVGSLKILQNAGLVFAHQYRYEKHLVNRYLEPQHLDTQGRESAARYAHTLTAEDKANNAR